MEGKISLWCLQAIILVTVICNVFSRPAGPSRRVTIVKEGADIRQSRDGGFIFPDEIEFTIRINGMGTKHFKANRSFRPIKDTAVIIMGKNSKMHRKNNAKKEIEYYTDTTGAYACKLSFIEGKPHCDLVGVVHSDTESCFLKGNEAFCEEKRNGTWETEGDYPEKAPPVPYPGNRTQAMRESRHKRQITVPDNDVRVIQIAFFLDAAHMNRFYQLNGGDVDAGQEDAEMYITMVANEMTYRYQTVKELDIDYRGGTLDLAVNPSHIFYPAADTDFSFIIKYDTFLHYYTLYNFRDYVNGLTIDGVWHHAMLVSGLILTFSNGGSGLLGVAYVSTVCSSSSSKVSMNEDRAYSLVDTAAHELGHAFGARHDSDGNSCASGMYIMSSYGFFPDSTTKDTAYTFSSCSGNYFANHLGSQSDCLSSKDENDFLDNFCAGPRGLRGASFDYQCQNYYAYGPGYTECFGTTAVTPDGCWLANSIYCYPGSGYYCYSLTFLMDGSPCIGTDSSENHYCYLGECVAEDTICLTSTSSPTTS